MFHSRNHTNSNSSKNEEYEILSEPTMRLIYLFIGLYTLCTCCYSYQIPPEAPFTPKSPSTIKAMDHFRVSHGWLISEDGPTPSTLPSFYCQLMLKEYHVTDAVSGSNNSYEIVINVSKTIDIMYVFSQSVSNLTAPPI